jgi:hypothetical protein
MVVDTVVAEINVVGRRWYSQFSARFKHRPCITLFQQWLCIQMFFKIRGGTSLVLKIICALLIDTLENIVSKMVVDTIVAQNKVVGRC